MPKDTWPARWLLLSVLGLAAAFVANTAYSRRVAAEIDAHSTSITENGAASVVYLGTVTEDIRIVSARAMRARPESLFVDRATIAWWLEDMGRAIADYRRAGDYPGEYQLYLEAEKRHEPFVLSVENCLATVGGAPEVHTASLDRLSSAADTLAGSIRELSQLNANHVASEGAAIAEVRQHSGPIFLTFRAITLVLAVLGVLLSSVVNRQHAALVDRARRLAEARASELDMFAGRVAHDLRAPLTVIQVKSTAAQRTESTEALKDALDRIGRQGHRMANIIDALLAFAQAGARAEPETCENIAEVIQEVVLDNQSIVAPAGFELLVEPVPPAMVACSASVLGIVLSNLVRNAIKYMGAGRDGVRRVSIRVRRRDDRLRFEVEDTGPGLPRGTEKMLFEPFVRLSGASGQGVGLGLATVKRLVEAHGGAVGVESVPTRGCTFWFDLPGVLASPTSIAGRDIGSRPTNGAPRSHPSGACRQDGSL
jgi:signal transduction histidine kinase